MQKSIFAASLLLAGVAFADTSVVETEYVLGVMPVNATGKTQVILSIPWVAEGGGDTIAVSNLVKTAGLAAVHPGDTILKWYNGTGYESWTLKSNDGTNYWSEASMLDPAVKDLSRGQAVVLSTTNGTFSTIYVVGQVGTNATVTTTIAANSEGNWFLFAPPCASTSDIDLNEYATFPVDCEGDRITVDGVNYYTYMNLGTEYKWTRSKYAESHTATIPAGRGFWYQRATNNTDAVTITWKSVPSAN